MADREVQEPPGSRGQVGVPSPGDAQRAGYGAAAAVCTAVLIVALLASGLFAVRRDLAGRGAAEVAAS